jgi:hypothetical protein
MRKEVVHIGHQMAYYQVEGFARNSIEIFSLVMYSV